MDIIGLSLDVFTLAKSVIDDIEEVKAFKTRCKRLSQRIQSLLPALEVLAQMTEERDKIIQLQKEDKNIKMPVFNSGLNQLMSVVKDADKFAHSLQKIDFLKQLLKRRKIGDQFDTFGERLDILQGNVQFGILVEMNKLMKKLSGDERSNEFITDMKERLGRSKKVLQQRLDIDLDDGVQDDKELLHKVNAGEIIIVQRLIL